MEGKEGGIRKEGEERVEGGEQKERKNQSSITTDHPKVADQYGTSQKHQSINIRQSG